MLGTVRFILSLLVVNAHLGFGLWSFGVVAVLCFYFMSGYLMHLSFKRFKENKRSTIYFYADRLFKLYPAYFYTITLTIIILYLFGDSNNYAHLSLQKSDTLSLLMNYLLLPTQYSFFGAKSDFIRPLLFPASWSLAAEFHFYLLVPLIYNLKKEKFLLLLVLTATLQALILINGKALNNKFAMVFGYVMFVGPLCVFIAGMAFRRFKSEACVNSRNAFIFYLFFWYIFSLFIAPALNILNYSYVKPILFGLIIGPLVFQFSIATKLDQVPFMKKFDNILGNIAYPLFVSHFLTFLISEKIFHISWEKMHLRVIALLLCILHAYFISVLLSKIEKYRINFRGFQSLKTTLNQNLS